MRNAALCVLVDVPSSLKAICRSARCWQRGEKMWQEEMKRSEKSLNWDRAMPPTGRTVVVLFMHTFVEVNESEKESKLRSNDRKKAKKWKNVKTNDECQVVLLHLCNDDKVTLGFTGKPKCLFQSKIILERKVLRWESRRGHKPQSVATATKNAGSATILATKSH